MKIKITSPVQHDAKNLAPGDIVNLSDDAAYQLIGCGAAEPVGRATAKGEPDLAALAEIDESGEQA